jgi:hypothetical protein
MTYTKCNRSKLVILADRERQQTLIASLLRVEEQILGVETSAAHTIQLAFAFSPSPNSTPTYRITQGE